LFVLGYLPLMEGAFNGHPPTEFCCFGYTVCLTRVGGGISTVLRLPCLAILYGMFVDLLAERLRYVVRINTSLQVVVEAAEPRF
jgi:hypothetical protein